MSGSIEALYAKLIIQETMTLFCYVCLSLCLSIIDTGEFKFFLAFENEKETKLVLDEYVDILSY